MADSDWTAAFTDWGDHAWSAVSKIAEGVLLVVGAVLGMTILFTALSAVGLLAGQMGLFLIFLAFISCSC